MFHIIGFPDILYDRAIARPRFFSFCFWPRSAPCAWDHNRATAPKDRAPGIALSVANIITKLLLPFVQTYGNTHVYKYVRCLPLIHSHIRCCYKLDTRPIRSKEMLTLVFKKEVCQTRVQVVQQTYNIAFDAELCWYSSKHNSWHSNSKSARHAPTSS